jgi:hypothetical protein
VRGCSPSQSFIPFPTQRAVRTVQCECRIKEMWEILKSWRARERPESRAGSVDRADGTMSPTHRLYSQTVNFKVGVVCGFNASRMTHRCCRSVGSV